MPVVSARGLKPPRAPAGEPAASRVVGGQWALALAATSARGRCAYPQRSDALGERSVQRVDPGVACALVQLDLPQLLVWRAVSRQGVDDAFHRARVPSCDEHRASRSEVRWVVLQSGEEKRSQGPQAWNKAHPILAPVGGGGLGKKAYGQSQEQTRDHPANSS